MRIFRKWRERGMFESTEQSVCNQARPIKRNGWLSELELETKNRQVEGESLGELCRKQDGTVDSKTV